MNKETRTAIFENMPVPQAVLRQVIPAIASQMIVLIYNLADTYFVGMLNDPRQTAAIMVAYSPFVMLTALSNLFGVGGASLIARALGQKNSEDARQISSLSFWMGLMTALLFSVFFTALAHPILFLCGATEDTFPPTYGYAWFAIILGGPFVILNTLLANLVRAEGSSIHASVGVSLGGLLNILLDPLFILPGFLGMGASGAGLATALSNAAASFYFLFYLIFKRNTTVLSIRPSYLRFFSKHIRKLLSIGFPSALQYALTVVSVGALSHFVSRYTTEAVAALGIVKKLDQIPLYFSIGASNGLLPLLAYNYASGDQKRRKQIFRLGCGISVGFSILCFALFQLFAPGLASLFIADAKTIRYGADFLRIMVTAMPFMAFCYPIIIQFQAMGKVKESLIVSILRKGVLDLPLLFLMDSFFPLYGCMWVQPMVDFISLFVAGSFLRRINRSS